MMRHIYQNASYIFFACVGSHDDDSELVIRFFCEVKSFEQGMTDIDRASALTFIKDTIKSLAWAITTQDEQENGSKSIFTFMERSYFKRLWILQEVSTAGISDMNTGWLCSCNLLNIVAFLTMIRQGMTRASILDWQKSRCDPASNSCCDYCADPRYRYLAYRASKLDQRFLLHPLLELTRDLQCQDLRDKINGALSKVGWQDVLPIEPDYTSDIFGEAVLEMTSIIEQSKCSEIHCSEESCYQALAHKSSESVDIH
ncbi:uncharacterized protein EAF01_003877 [Botrytis porri]|uniref:uncharacterized protein n=1 Tax=Botrytis porri TaxID=87229 RepID=UPI001901177F|nr:uncharacterized protein EAF01_003877 [Botrytis porri]KAF7908122.1 hypothetical protein EAF01_003877 [Botrytis porri]